MGNKTQLERIIDLEAAVSVLKEEVCGLRGLCGTVNVFIEDEMLRRRNVSERMKKARAGRKYGKKAT